MSEAALQPRSDKRSKAWQSSSSPFGSPRRAADGGGSCSDLPLWSRPHWEPGVGLREGPRQKVRSGEMLKHPTAISYLCNRPKQGYLTVLPVKCLQGDQRFETCGFGLPAIHLDGSSLFGAVGQQKTGHCLWPGSEKTASWVQKSASHLRGSNTFVINLIQCA